MLAIRSRHNKQWYNMGFPLHYCFSLSAQDTSFQPLLHLSSFLGAELASENENHSFRAAMRNIKSA